MKVTDPLLPCGVCKGTGCRKLSKTASRIFHLIGSMKGPSAVEILKALNRPDMNKTGVYHHAARLVKAGLVRKQETKGKWPRYFQVNGEK